MIDVPALRSALSPRRTSVLYLLALIFVVFSITIPDLFLSPITMQSVARSQAVVGILALGALLPFVVGEFDISIGANMAVSVIVIAHLSNENPGLGILGMCLIAVTVCGLVGVANGLLVGRFGINSFIATLATSQILAAAALYLSNNEQILAALPQGFMDVGQGRTLSVPNGLFGTILLGIVIWYVLRFTKLGRHLYAAGFNREAARLSGVRTELLVVSSFAASGVIAGLAGVVFIGQVGTFSNAIGAPLLFPAYAAVFLGATQFSFRPNVWGTLISIFTLALGVQGLQLWSAVGAFWITPLFNGVALVAAVMFSRRLSVRRATGRAGTEHDETEGPRLVDPEMPVQRDPEVTRQ